MANVPGYCGYPLIGDKSIEFYKDPEKFVSNNIQESSSKVFQCRLLNKKTVFICSHKETKEILEEKWKNFDHGYRDFLYNSFGDNILFESGNDATAVRQCIMTVLSETMHYKPLVDRMCKNFIDVFPANGTALNIYKEFKGFMTKLCLELFLGFSDESSETSNTIAELATLHWHGIISMPVNLKIPFAGRTGWHKALEAKEKLLDHIRMLISEEKGKNVNSNAYFKNVFQAMLRAPFKNSATEVEQHILLFISSLIPKAFSSIITSFVLQMSGENKKQMRETTNSDSEFHKRTLLETQRLWPPFFGGRRIANRDTIVGKYKIPKGYAVIYVSHFAHRDPDAFLNPEVFDPDRWSKETEEMPQIFTFGGGERACVGQQLIQYIFLKMTKTLLENYDWSVEGPEGMPAYKVLPVSRPAELPLVRFQRK